MRRLGRLEILLVRHATTIPPGAPGYGEHDLPLSEAGRADAAELADELEPYEITAVYSSPYPRAVQTVEPTARRRNLPVQQLDDMRERLLSSAALPDWRDHLERSWLDADYAPQGGETGRAAQRRGLATLDLLRMRHPDGGRLLVGSHGNLISLILQALEPGVDYAFHAAMPNPAIYHLEHDGVGWRVLGGHGFQAIDEAG